MSTPTMDALRGTLMGSANFEFKSKYLRVLEKASPCYLSLVSF